MEAAASKQKSSIDDCPIFGGDSCIDVDCRYFHVNESLQRICRYDEMKVYRELVVSGKSLLITREKG